MLPSGRTPPMAEPYTVRWVSAGHHTGVDAIGSRGIGLQQTERVPPRLHERPQEPRRDWGLR